MTPGWYALVKSQERSRILPRVTETGEGVEAEGLPFAESGRREVYVGICSQAAFHNARIHGVQDCNVAIHREGYRVGLTLGASPS